MLYLHLCHSFAVPLLTKIILERLQWGPIAAPPVSEMR